jgi:hypothetical protein
MFFRELSQHQQLPSHGRACPGHLDTENRRASTHRDHRHKAGDDVRSKEWRMVLWVKKAS